MEPLDLEAPGRAQPSLAERFKALWQSLRGGGSSGFKRLAQEDAPEAEEIITEAGIACCTASAVTAANVRRCLLSSCNAYIIWLAG